MLTKLYEHIKNKYDINRTTLEHMGEPEDLVLSHAKSYFQGRVDAFSGLLVELSATYQDFVAVRSTEYKRLKEKSDRLDALEQAGVDNWEGYSHAFEILNEWRDEDAGNTEDAE